MPAGSKPGERRGGRQKGTPNKSTLEIKELAGAHAPKVIAMLADIAVGLDERKEFKHAEEVRIKAGEILLNRAYGRPAQQLQHAGHDGGPLDLEGMTAEELEAKARQLLAGLGDSKDKK